MAFDVSALPAFDAQRDVSEFFTKVVLGTKMASFMRVMDGIKTDRDIPDITHSYDILQRGSCTRTTRGTTTFDSRRIRVDDILVAEDWCVKDLEDTMVQLAMNPGANTDALPSAVAPTIDQVLMEGLNKAVEIGLWQADKDAGSPSYLGTFTGLNKRIDDAITAAEIPAGQQLSNTPTISTIVADVEAMYDALSIDVRFAANLDRFKLFLSWDNWRLFNKGFRADFTALPYNVGFDQMFIPGTSIELVPVAGLDGTNKMVLADPQNLILGTDLQGEENSIRFYPDIHWLNVHATGQFRLGTQIHFPDEIVVNDY